MVTKKKTTKKTTTKEPTKKVKIELDTKDIESMVKKFESMVKKFENEQKETLELINTNTKMIQQLADLIKSKPIESELIESNFDRSALTAKLENRITNYISMGEVRIVLVPKDVQMIKAIAVAVVEILGAVLGVNYE